MNRRRFIKILAGTGIITTGATLHSCSNRPVPPLKPLPVKPLIDMHVHVAGIGAGNSACYLSPFLRNNWRYRIYLEAFGTTQSELEKKGDAYVFKLVARSIDSSRYVDGAVVLALDGAVTKGSLDLDRTEVYIPSEYVAAQTRKYPNLFYGASVNPHRHDALRRLERAVAEGALLLKWLPNIQNIRMDDPELIPFYRRMVNLDLPLLTHVGAELSFPRSDNTLGDPLLLQLPLEQGVRVIAAHAGYSGSSKGEANVDRLLGLMPKYPNLFADISSLTQINKHSALSKVLGAGMHDRLLYGSDAPLINTSLVTPWSYMYKLNWDKVRQIQKQGNPWDRDVLLKHALGVPPEVFERSARFLRIMI
jgi:uncharacterized protein